MALDSKGMASQGDDRNAKAERCSAEEKRRYEVRRNRGAKIRGATAELGRAWRRNGMATGRYEWQRHGGSWLRDAKETNRLALNRKGAN